MQIAEKHVIGGARETGEGFFHGRGAIHAQAVRGESFLQKHTDAFFIVENEDRPALENAGGGMNRFGGNGAEFSGTKEGLRRLADSDGKINGERRTPGGKRFGFNVAAMLANDGHADAEAESGAASGALRGVERIEDAWERFRANADAIILNSDSDAIGSARKADLNAAGVADFADRLLRIGDQIQKNLDELVRVADDGGKSGLGMKIDFDAVAAERVLMQLESSLEEAIDVQRFFLRGGRA